MANIKTFNKIAYSFMAIFTRGRFNHKVEQAYDQETKREERENMLSLRVHVSIG